MYDVTANCVVIIDGEKTIYQKVIQVQEID